LQWRVGHKASIPIVLAIYLDGGKAGWQCSARHDVLWPNRVGFGVEVDEIARPHIDSARAVTRDAGVETIKVDEALQRVLERFGVVETVGPQRASRLQPWHRGARGEESRCTERGSQIRAHLIEETARVVALGPIRETTDGPVPKPVRRYLRP